MYSLDQTAVDRFEQIKNALAQLICRWHIRAPRIHGNRESCTQNEDVTHGLSPVPSTDPHNVSLMWNGFVNRAVRSVAELIWGAPKRRFGVSVFVEQAMG